MSILAMMAFLCVAAVITCIIFARLQSPLLLSINATDRCSASNELRAQGLWLEEINATCGSRNSSDSMGHSCCSDSCTCQWMWADSLCREIKSLPNTDTWLIVSGDSIGRIFYVALLEKLGMCLEGSNVRKGSLGYLFQQGNLRLVYIGVRFPEDVTTLATTWQYSSVSMWDNASNARVWVPRPHIWIVTCGMHSMLYRSNDSTLGVRLYDSKLAELMPAAALVPSRRFWLFSNEFNAATMPQWKTHLLHAQRLHEWQNVTRRLIVPLFTPIFFPNPLPKLLEPMDGIHPPVCAYCPLAHTLLHLLAREAAS